MNGEPILTRAEVFGIITACMPFFPEAPDVITIVTTGMYGEKTIEEESLISEEVAQQATYMERMDQM